MKSRKFFRLSAALLLLLAILSGCGVSDIAPPETTGTLPGDTASAALPEVTEAGVPDEFGSYTSMEDVAEYLIAYGHLPDNFITKKEAKALGWDSRQGNLWDVAPGKSIGGDRFGNFEELLPEGNYRECDIDYDGGHRNTKRIVYSDQGHIYYTDDHYESFTLIYGE